MANSLHQRFIRRFAALVVAGLVLTAGVTPWVQPAQAAETKTEAQKKKDAKKKAAQKKSQQQKAAEKKKQKKQSQNKSSTKKKKQEPVRSSSRSEASRKKSSAPVPVADGKKQSEVQASLAEVGRQIATIQKQVSLTREQREQKERELRKAEVQIGNLRRDLRSATQEADSRRRSLDELAEQRVQLEKERAAQLAQLRRDVQMSFRVGQNDYFKLLLNQEHPEKFARLLRYYDYVQRERGARIVDLQKTDRQLADIQKSEAQGIERLEELSGTLRNQQAELAVAQTEREQALTVLKAQLESQQDQLRRLQRDRQELQSVMAGLERAAREAERQERARELAAARQKADEERRKREEENRKLAAQGKPVKPDVPVTPSKVDPVEKPYSSEPDYSVSAYKGRCPLPVDGGIRVNFGEARMGGLRWNGVVIAAPQGSPVRAIRPGKVVFSDYLRGFGLLAIVDHGKGLMSLYGQNQSLLKKVGEPVAANESLALSGASGGNESGLYFEIRLRGRPSNPLAWCGS